jgi:hypothetical protein
MVSEISIHGQLTLVFWVRVCEEDTVHHVRNRRLLTSWKQREREREREERAKGMPPMA